MKILVFSAFDPIPSDPAEPIRYARLAELLLEKDHEIQYITSSFFHLKKTQRTRYWDKPDNTPDGLDLITLPARPYKRHVGIGRLLNQRDLQIELHKHLQSLSKTDLPQLVIAASPPLGTANVLLRWSAQKRISSILDIQDLWPHEMERFVPGWAKAGLWPIHRMATENARFASAVCGVSEDYLQVFEYEIAAKPTAVFHLGIDTAGFKDPFYTANNNAGVALLSSATSERQIATALAAIQSLPETELVVYGKDGNHGPNVRYRGFVSQEELHEELPGLGCGLVITEPKSRIAFPNRAFAYLAAGLPIVSTIQGGELERCLAGNGLGLTVPDDAPAIAEAIRRCLAFTYEQRRHIQHYAREHFERHRIIERYAEWARELV